MLVAPSILSANFGKLDEEIISICKSGCDLIHVDVMDGHFVPNITMGPIVVNAVKKIATKPLDIHLMVENNSFFVELFAPLKPKYISFHLESEKHPHRLIQKIKSYGIKPAIALNPHSTLKSVEYLLQDLDMILLMSVNPGFEGQKFIPNILEKLKKLKSFIVEKSLNCLIEVDGGVNNENINELKKVGVDIVVAGSYVFKSSNYLKAIKSLQI